jgi:hypothetical protein
MGKIGRILSASLWYCVNMHTASIRRNASTASIYRRVYVAMQCVRPTGKLIVARSNVSSVLLRLVRHLHIVLRVVGRLQYWPLLYDQVHANFDLTCPFWTMLPLKISSLQLGVLACAFPMDIRWCCRRKGNLKKNVLSVWLFCIDSVLVHT